MVPWKFFRGAPKLSTFVLYEKKTPHILEQPLFVWRPKLAIFEHFRTADESEMDQVQKISNQIATGSAQEYEHQKFAN